MANNYYTFTPSFVPGAKVRANEVNVQYQALETAFDNLPTAADSLTTGKATFAPESGTGNAFVVTMPDTRTSNADGDEIIFFASHGNTGAVTLNVDAIGAVSMVDRSGAALISGDIVSGILYVATYDSSNSRFVLDVTANVVTNIVDVVQGTSTNNPESPGIFNANLGFENASGNPLADIGFNSDINMGIYNRVHGGNVVIGAENAAGALQSLVTIDPDTKQVILPLEFDAATPTLAFGDGDSGFYESQDDTVDLAIAGVHATRFDATHMIRGSSNAFPALLRQNPSDTAPSINPRQDDPNTGIGYAANDALSLIAGGIEAIRLREASSGVVQTHEANTGLTADVGSSQGDGVILSTYNVYSTVGTAGDAATLPAQPDYEVGTLIYVKNDAAVNSMDVFPASGDDAGAGVNTAVAIAASDFAVFLATSLSAWTKLMGGSA